MELAREDYSQRELGNKAAQKAAQGTQQRSPESVCLVNFRCGDTGRVKQGLTPPVTLHTHTHRGRYSQPLQPDTLGNASRSLPMILLIP